LYRNKGFSYYRDVEFLGEKVKDLDHEAIGAVLDGHDTAISGAGVHRGKDCLEVDVRIEGLIRKNL
jgi:hypothetical protein